MMLPSPRIIAIDDEPTHLRGLADGLNSFGVACLQVHFTGDDTQLKPCPHVRVIFADLHLNEGGAGMEDARHFTVIGGFIEQTIIPSGPYIIVLWTRFADRADALATFLEERLLNVPKPFIVTALDKNEHLDEEGKVKDSTRLVQAIQEAISKQPQVAALLNWEERVLGAASDTVGAIVGLTTTGANQPPRSAQLGRLLSQLAKASVGEGHVERDRFHAVNEALLPILADRVSVLKGQNEADDPWKSAFSEADLAAGVSAQEAAQLNRFLHIAEGEAGISAADRGAVFALPAQFAGEAFKTTCGMEEAETAGKQFGCKTFNTADESCRWVLIQVQAICDYAQRQPGPLPFVLALEMPNSAKSTSSLPAALWVSPVMWIRGAPRILAVNSRFQVMMPETHARQIAADYRLREQILGELVYRIHSHGARPGILRMDESKPRAAPAAKAGPKPTPV
jgi:hypothetical protein